MRDPAPRLGPAPSAGRLALRLGRAAFRAVSSSSSPPCSAISKRSASPSTQTSIDASRALAGTFEHSETAEVDRTGDLGRVAELPSDVDTSANARHLPPPHGSQHARPPASSSGG